MKNERWTLESVSPTKALLEGKVTFWAHLANLDPETGQWTDALPENDCTVSIALVKVAGVWKVSEYIWHFVPGSEP